MNCLQSILHLYLAAVANIVEHIPHSELNKQKQIIRSPVSFLIQQLNLL